MISMCEPPVASGAFFPGIVTARPLPASEFYIEHFGFHAAVAEPDFVLLIGASGQRLAIKRAGDDSQPAALQVATRGTGLWLVIEVADPGALHERLVMAGAEIIAAPETTPAGARRFVVRDPSGVLLHVIERAHAESAAGAAFRPEIFHDQHHRHSVHRLSRH